MKKTGHRTIPSAHWLEFDLVFAGPEDIDLLVAHRSNMWREVRPELGTKMEESEEWTRED